MRVDLEEVRQILKEKGRINRIPLELMEIYDGGKQIEIDPKLIDEWEFIGLNNIGFIEAYLLRDKSKL